jgi:hypothetical protein
VRGRILVLLLLSVATDGCITRTVRESVFEQDRTEVLLRSERRIGQPIERGFEHPLTISSVRIAHILSRIDVREEAEEGSQRLPAIPIEALYTIAEGVAQAFAKAGPDQEVVVMSIRRTKRFGIFDREYLTSFLAYVKDDLLYVHLSRLDWEIPPRREDRLPEPHAGEHVMRFRVLRGEQMTPVDPQSVAVAWRDPIFQKPTRTHVTAGGRVVRRTILLESEEAEALEPELLGPEAAETGPLPADLSPDDLRELADLEEARRRGEITESQYLARRSEILERK